MVLGNSLSKGLLCRIITLEFSTQIYYILLKTIALFFHEEDLINQLKKEGMELCLYDLSTHEILFSYGANVSKINTSNIENYMVHDKSLEKSFR